MAKNSANVKDLGQKRAGHFLLSSLKMKEVSRTDQAKTFLFKQSRTQKTVLAI